MNFDAILQGARCLGILIQYAVQIYPIQMELMLNGAGNIKL